MSATEQARYLAEELDQADMVPHAEELRRLAGMVDEQFTELGKAYARIMGLELDLAAARSSTCGTICAGNVRDGVECEPGQCAAMAKAGLQPGAES
jgi:hypothetical protein